MENQQSRKTEEELLREIEPVQSALEQLEALRWELYESYDTVKQAVTRAKEESKLMGDEELEKVRNASERLLTSKLVMPKMVKLGYKLQTQSNTAYYEGSRYWETKCLSENLALERLPDFMKLKGINNTIRPDGDFYVCKHSPTTVYLLNEQTFSDATRAILEAYKQFFDEKKKEVSELAGIQLSFAPHDELFKLLFAQKAS